MTADQIAKTIVAEALHTQPDMIDESVSSTTSDLWDSVAHINIMLAVEEHIGGGIPIEQIFQLNSVPSIALFLDQHTPNK